MNEAQARTRAVAVMQSLFADAIRSGPAIVHENGEREYRVTANAGLIRCILPLTMLAQSVGILPDEEREFDLPRIGEDEELSVGEGNVILDGVASSSSVDWYGTEMSLAALEDMREQFGKGVSLFPRHGGWLDEVGWSDEFGRTLRAQVIRADVAEPHEEEEGNQGFILRMQAELFTSIDELAVKLRDRLAMEAPQPIGLSIGGWFTDMRFFTDDDGDIIRIIVEKVLLDHLAVVRSPANPDATILKLVRSVIAAAIADIGPIATIKVDRKSVLAVALAAGTDVGDITDDASFRATLGAAELTGLSDGGHLSPQVRHVVGALQTDHTVVYQYLKGGFDPEDIDDGELISELIGESSDEDEDDLAAGEADDTRVYCAGDGDCPAGEDCIGNDCRARDDADYSSEEPAESRNNPDNPVEVTTGSDLDNLPPVREDEPEPASTTDRQESTEDPMTEEQLAQLLAAIGLNKVATEDLGKRIDVIEERSLSDGGHSEPEPDPEPDPAPAPANQPSAREVELEATLATLNTKVDTMQRGIDLRDDALNSMAGVSSRGGHAFSGGVVLPTDPEDAASVVEQLLSRCKDNDDESRQMCAVIKRATIHVDGTKRSIFSLNQRAKGRTSEGAAFRTVCGDADEILKRICRAADNDGTLKYWIRTVGPQL